MATRQGGGISTFEACLTKGISIPPIHSVRLRSSPRKIVLTDAEACEQYTVTPSGSSRMEHKREVAGSQRLAQSQVTDGVSWMAKRVSFERAETVA